MRFAAFFRNVNFGHVGSPIKAQFIAAFEAVGAQDMSSFLTHGNASFSASNAAEAISLADAAREQLRRVCGWDGVAYTRSITYLAKRVASDPFVGAPQDDINDCCVTFLPDRLSEMPVTPIVVPRRDMEVFDVRAGEAFSVTRLVGGRVGNVNGLLERLLKAPLTTRNWNTVVRLVERES
ncbi:DUF1697 domain-containing protein [Dyella tabacisoli]|uniref:DUF1697 domain-containing protein n=1 Tax=Dyella tabacisoli TaxID=2282381 RepID=UPI0013B42972|nr:DUF1697 domain-containing protein [Dyella tabacisoli]